jgi:hypothetical protein
MPKHASRNFQKREYSDTIPRLARSRLMEVDEADDVDGPTGGALAELSKERCARVSWRLPSTSQHQATSLGLVSITRGGEKFEGFEGPQGLSWRPAAPARGGTAARVRVAEATVRCAVPWPRRRGSV